jgi:hypothetical protein
MTLRLFKKSSTTMPHLVATNAAAAALLALVGPGATVADAAAINAAVAVNAVSTNAVVAADSVAANAVVANAIVATKSRRRSHRGRGRETRHNNKLALEIQAAVTNLRSWQDNTTIYRLPGPGSRSSKQQFTGN